MDDRPLPSVRFVVVNFDAGELLARAVDSILTVDWPDERRQVWVIDNASTDSSLEGIRDDDDVHVIRNHENRGFGANNQAFADLDAIDYVALVNPDAVIDPSFLDPLVAALEADESLGGACPKILLDGDEDPSIVQNAGSYLLRNGNAGDIGFGRPDGPGFDVERDVFAFCGAAVLLRASMLTELGGFDESFFLYYEDTDLSWRAQLRGWGFRYVPSAAAYHRHGYSTGLVGIVPATLQVRNRLTMVFKNAPLPMALGAAWRAVSGLLVAAIRRRGDGPSTRARARGISDAFTRIRSTLTQRDRVDSPTRRRVARQLTNRPPDITSRHMSQPEPT